MINPPVPCFRIPYLPLPQKSQDIGLIRQPCSQFEEKIIRSNLRVQRPSFLFLFQDNIGQKNTEVKSEQP